MIVKFTKIPAALGLASKVTSAKKPTGLRSCIATGSIFPYIDDIDIKMPLLAKLTPDGGSVMPNSTEM